MFFLLIVLGLYHLLCMYLGNAVEPQFFVPANPRPTYLSYSEICHLIVPYLDAYKIFLTMSSFFLYATAYAPCHPDVLRWYQSYLQQQCFVSDPVHGVVRTSVGNVVYSDLELQVHRLVAIPATSRFAVANAAATCTVYTDIDSVLCTYCNKTRHSTKFCWKHAKDESDCSSVWELWQL